MRINTGLASLCLQHHPVVKRRLEEEIRKHLGLSEKPEVHCMVKEVQGIKLRLEMAVLSIVIVDSQCARCYGLAHVTHVLYTFLYFSYLTLL